jgi:hypothetical protein
MGSFDQNSSYIPPFFAVFAQTLGQFPQNVGFCPDFLYIAHLGIPEIWAIARKDEFAQKLIFRCRNRSDKVTLWYLVLWDVLWERRFETISDGTMQRIVS